VVRPHQPRALDSRLRGNDGRGILDRVKIQSLFAEGTSMTDAYCGRAMQHSPCFLAECRVAGECRFSSFDSESNDAFNEALDKSMPRPRLLDDDGGIQLCEQCNSDDGKAVEIGIDGIRTSRVWAHNAFDSGVCRWVFICHVCWWAVQMEVYQGIEPWFGWSQERFSRHQACAACRAEAGT
jgi:hypothetical protein